jgi:hypothetical protein
MFGVLPSATAAPREIPKPTGFCACAATGMLARAVRMRKIEKDMPSFISPLPFIYAYCIAILLLRQRIHGFVEALLTQAIHTHQVPAP